MTLFHAMNIALYLDNKFIMPRLHLSRWCPVIWGPLTIPTHWGLFRRTPKLITAGFFLVLVLVILRATEFPTDKFETIARRLG